MSDILPDDRIHAWVACPSFKDALQAPNRGRWLEWIWCMILAPLSGGMWILPIKGVWGMGIFQQLICLDLYN